MARHRVKKKYLYIVIEWGKHPVPFSTKLELTEYLDKKNPRLVDKWFGKNWFCMIDKYFVAKVEVPKVKSKIRTI